MKVKEYLQSLINDPEFINEEIPTIGVLITVAYGEVCGNCGVAHKLATQSTGALSSDTSDKGYINLLVHMIKCPQDSESLVPFYFRAHLSAKEKAGMN